jgi:N-acetyl-anhydromuramyl-L-alanine amidase AmpD
MRHAITHLESLESRRFLSATSPLAATITPAAAPTMFELSAPLGPAQPAATFNASPNFNSRGGTKIDSIVIHTTEGSYASAVATFKNPANQVSAHYIVDTNGAITQMVDLANRAWHATYYNSRSIGIEIVGFAGQASTWNAQNVAAVEKLVAWLAWKYDVPVVHPGGNAYDYPNDQLNVSGIVAHGQVQPWNRTDPGPYFLWDSFISSVRKIIDQSAQQPFTGTPFNLGRAGTATLQAENYDRGGEGYAFHDTTPTVNTGGAYRTAGALDGVDVKRINGTSNLYRLGDTFAGEWVEYTLNIGKAGSYRLDFRLSQSDPNARLHAELDGKSIASITVPDTNSFSVFTTVSRTLQLPAGRHVLRLAFDRVARNGTVAGVDWIKFSPVATTASTFSSSSSAFSSSSALIGGRTVTSAFDAVQSELERPANV